jgi:hypothetical protein
MRILALGLVLAFPMLAQIGGSGSIQGVVSDPSSAVIPGASVVATNVATGVKTIRTTTDAGYYVLSPLPPGEYTVSATVQGFQTLTQEHIVVDALATVGLNLTMKIGTSAEQVTVVDAPPQLNTSDARMGQTIRNEQYTALPLAMGNAPRDPVAFVSLMPGFTGGVGNTAGNVLGAQANTGEVYVEGMPMTNPAVQGETRNLSLGVSVESVDQFQLETAGAAVEYQGQGATNFVVKSGTNAFHGAAYEFFRNTQLDARGFFGKTRPAEHQNEYGVNVGGPVRKNRLFFFGSWDGFRYRTGTAPTLVTVPTAAARLGDFSAFGVTIFDPHTTNCSSGPCTRKPFANNQIPANEISAVSKYLQANLPPPINNALQNNYLGSLPTGFNNDNTTDKVDFNHTDQSRYFVLFSRGHRSQSNSYRGAGNSLPLPYTDTRLVDEYTATAQFRHTYVINASMVNQFSYSFSQLWVPITNATIDGDWMNKAGVKGLPAGEAASSFPEIAWGGPNVPTGWRGTNSRGFIEALNDYAMQDNVQWTHGKHALTFGFQVQWLQANERTDAYGSLATWNMSNTQTAGFNAAGTLQTTTGNAYASFLLGAVNSANVTEDSVVGTGGRFLDYAWWVQDTYKVTPRLTLNLGLRHDIWGPYKEVLNRESFFNPSSPNPAAGGYPGILQFYGNGPASCHCSSNVATDYKNFGPRIGLAYSLNDKTVIRAGYSIMYSHRGAVGGRGGARTGTGTLGFSASPSFTSPDQGISPAFYWDNGLPTYQRPPFFDSTYGTAFNGITATGATMQYGDPSLGGTPPRYQNWNFGVERALTPTLTLSVAYVGNNGHFLGGGGRGIWSDQIDPKYLVLGNLLQQQATAANLAAANKIVPGIALPYPSFAGSISQMLRPFPQYPNVSDLWGDVANSNYNSMQLVLRKSFSHGLTFHFNYTFAKGFDDTGGTRSAYNWHTEKAVSTYSPHVVNAFFLYHLPFGKGQRWGGGNAVARALTGGWQLSGITSWASGTPIATVTATCNLPNAGSCYADYNPAFSGPVRIGGGYGSGDLLSAVYLDKTAFSNPLAFTYGSTPRTYAYELLNPNTFSTSASLRREFPIHESIKLAIQLDAFNPFNWVVFNGPSITLASSGFGKITSTSSSPRVVQFNLRVMF